MGKFTVLAFCIFSWGVPALRLSLEAGKQSQRAEVPGQDGMDIVMVSVGLDCIAKYSITKLREHVQHRKLYFVTKGDVCKAQRDELPADVECVDEDEALEGLTYAKVNSVLKQVDEAYVPKGHLPLAPRSGWYLQQFLKLAYPLSNKNISQDYLVFDADIFPTRNVTLYQDGKPSIKTGGHKGPWSDEYMRSFSDLSGGDQMKGPEHSDPEDRSTFVVHHMLFRKPWVQELLTAFGKHRPWDLFNTLPKMDGIPEFAQSAMSHAAMSNHSNGFSEYAFYASWVQSRHPEEISVIHEHGPTRHKRASFCESVGEEGDCCPEDYMFANDNKCYGSEISGLEGHANAAPKERDPNSGATPVKLKQTPECETKGMLQRKR